MEVADFAKLFRNYATTPGSISAFASVIATAKK
jgi:hypothetical protein